MDKFYNATTKIINVPGETKVPEDGIGCLLYNRMKLHSTKIAQIDAVTGEEDSMENLLQRCVQTAFEMKSMGIAPNDVISICSHNQLNNVVVLVSSLMIGAVLAPLDPTLTAKETAYLINLVNPKMIFSSEEAEKLIENSIHGLGVAHVVFGKTTKNIPFSNFLKPREELFRPYKVSRVDDTAIILFSSGTTGLPKGICLSHKYLYFHTHEAILQPCVGYATLYWVTSLIFTLSALLLGETKLIVSDYNPKTLWNYLEKYEVKHLFLSPFNAIQFYKNKPENIKVPLQELIVGGGSLSNDYILKLRKLLPNTKVATCYGQTELYTPFCVTSLETKIGSVGTPLAGRSCKIVDPETESALSFNQRGELRVKSEWCMNGYYKMDSSDVYDADGFLKTGDEAYYDEDFYFHIVDRIKEMFKYKSWHIVPAKLETVLQSHPGVEQVIVVGIPHPEDDNHALAVIKRAKGSLVSVEEIEEFANEQLDERHKLRAGIRFTESMPVTPSGKVKRRRLRDMCIAGEL